MKNNKITAVLAALLLLLGLAACGQAAPAAEPRQEETSVQIPNPWRDVTDAEAKELCPGSLKAPEGAENVRWSVMEAKGEAALVQLNFDLDGYTYTAREQVTDDKAADISGMYYTWTAQNEIALKNWGKAAAAGTYSRYIGENEWADLCAWYDTEKGVSYSLSVTAKDLDGFDLQAIAEALCASEAAAPTLSAEEQGSVPEETGRQDGERFEAVIILEGMEETVPYEHIRNEALGLEMDYDYERFARYTDGDRERFVSVWDDQDHPGVYLELTYSAENADAAADSVRAELSQKYDLLESTRELAGAGSCLRIEASVLKGTNNMADQIRAVYIIPASDGCRIAAAHSDITESEGFFRRFDYMLNTLSVMDRKGQGRLSDEQALSAVRKYCFAGNPGLEEIVNAGEQQVYWELESSTDDGIVVLFRSYTGAQIRYYIDPVSGEAYVTEFVPGLSSEETRTEESLNVRDYLD